MNECVVSRGWVWEGDRLAWPALILLQQIIERERERDPPPQPPLSSPHPALIDNVMFLRSISRHPSLSALSLRILLLLCDCHYHHHQNNGSQCTNTHCLLNYNTTHPPFPHPTNTDISINNSLYHFLRPYINLVNIYIYFVGLFEVDYHSWVLVSFRVHFNKQFNQ